MAKCLSLLMLVLLPSIVAADDSDVRVLLTARVVDAASGIGVEGIAIEFESVERRGPFFMKTPIRKVQFWTDGNGMIRAVLYIKGEVSFVVKFYSESYQVCDMDISALPKSIFRQVDYESTHSIDLEYKVQGCRPNEVQHKSAEN